ncbi:hypothetical protein VNO80_25205 [Phaseolus coccineus]|uniref:Uncharacterized protein n=1 Tax=Phaseolus coccineus TaxID=3886 RepID=A0AAN9QLR1_PHACN
MLSNISKAELAELTRKMRAAASLPKESLAQKRKALIVITQIPTDPDEQTTFGLVFKRRRPTPIPPTEHSHSDNRAPYQKAQRGDVESCCATTSVLADCRAATDQHPQPLRHHRPPPSWRMNNNPHKP